MSIAAFGGIGVASASALNLSGVWEENDENVEWNITSGTSTSISGTLDAGSRFSLTPTIWGTLSGTISNGTGEITATYNGCCDIGHFAGEKEEWVVTHAYVTSDGVGYIEGNEQGYEGHLEPIGFYFYRNQATTAPELSIAGTTVAEPTSGTGTANFSVTLSEPATSAVSVEYTTQNGSGTRGATAGRDYEATHGTLTFNPGETTKTLPVTLKASGFKGKRTFSVALSNAQNANITVAEATGTIVGPSPLRVTVTLALPPPFTGANPDIQQDEAGPIPQNVTATVTVKNTGGTPIENVTLPSSLTIGWHGPAPINALPIKQIGAPATLKLGTIAPGQSSRRSEYTVQVEGDGYFDIQALLTGSEGSEPVHALGTKTIEPTSQLLVMKNSLGAFVHGANNPSLVRAGTHFLIKVQLENRSYVNRLQIEPYYPELSGNALGGQLVPESEPTTYSNPTGSLEEVKDSPAIVLAPREKRIFSVVVGTAASDAFSQKSTGGGTRATIKFETPDLSTLDEADEPTSVSDDRTVLTPGSEEVQVGIDDSVAQPPPYDPWLAEWAVAKGVAYGLWGLTYGTVKGIYDLGAFGVKSVLGVPAAVLNEVGHMAALWRATENNPAARQALIETTVTKVYKAYNEAPWLLAKASFEMGMSIPAAVDKLVSGYFTRISNEWYAGNWEQAITDVAETGTNVVGLIGGPAILKAAGVGPAALRVAAGTLVRAEPVEAAWVAEEAATTAKTAEELEAVSEAVEPAETAVEALEDAAPGYQFTLAQMGKFFGMTADEVQWLSDFTNTRKISVVLRSRAEESIEWIKKGAMLKPSWIKSKNVTWLDRQFLGYSERDVGRVVMKKMPPLGELQAKLAAQGVVEGTPEYENVILRWQERNSTYAKEIKQMRAWNNADTIKGKWPWQESGIDPSVQADQIKDYKFRLRPDAYDPDALVPEVFNPVTKRFGSITGDIDLVAVTKADGSSFTQEEYVKILRELADSPLGIQHPDSTVWIKDGKFWFKAKEDYLASKGNVQFGPDGKYRSVQFNQALSKPEDWTQFAYRLIWDEGYQVGPGQGG